jgi:uncharacterized protein
MAHSPLEFSLFAFGFALAAGLVGSLLGVGGGIIVVPALTLVLGVDIRYAIGASIVSVIATSSGAAASYVKEHMTNLRVAMLLEIATVAGALSGAFLAGWVSGRWLYVLFGLILAYAGAAMFLNQLQPRSTTVPPDPWADRLGLHGSTRDAAGREVPYRVARTRTGFALSYVAGVVSGLLGVGGGIMKVPAMNLAMRMPIKTSTATSNFMIGVTAAASAAVYFARGEVVPVIAAPIAAGVLVGATAGSRLLPRIRSSWIRLAFVALLAFTAFRMLKQGFHA